MGERTGGDSGYQQEHLRVYWFRPELLPIVVNPLGRGRVSQEGGGRSMFEERLRTRETDCRASFAACTFVTRHATIVNIVISSG